MAAMKKNILCLFILVLILAPAISDAAYLIRLKNGGQLTTPAYWSEGNWIIFYCIGGTAGIEKSEIGRIERDDTLGKMAVVEQETSKAAPVPVNPANPRTAQEENNIRQIKEPETKAAEKVDIKAYKAEKDEMTADLNDMLEKRREAKQRRDMDEAARLTEQIIGKSGKIYEMTDEVTAKNKGKLPEGWWDKDK